MRTPGVAVHPPAREEETREAGVLGAKCRQCSEQEGAVVTDEDDWSHVTSAEN